jgi:hypothetical protein
MAHDVFVSYATAQRPLAFQLTKQFEDNQVSCWIAPRNIVSGTVWPEAIIAAITSRIAYRSCRSGPTQPRLPRPCRTC